MTNPDKKATLLLVDDETINLALLFEVLRQANYNVFIAKTAADTLRQIDHIQPDLILLDIMLPDMDGFELCRRLKAHPNTRQTPIIFLSALTNTATKFKGLNLGAVDYITKPFALEEVVTRVDKHLTISNLRRDMEEKNAQLEQINQALNCEIDERKQVEESLKKLSRVVEQTADLVLIVDIQGVIEYVNPAFEKLTGYTRAEILGQTPALLKSGQHRPEFYQNMWQTILQGQPFRDIIKNKKRDGSFFYEEKTITPLTDEHGNITHFVSTGKDITERVQTKSALEQRNHELDLINQASRAFNSTLELDQILQTVLQAMHTLLKITAASFWLYEPETTQLVCRHATGPGFEQIIGWRLAPGQGLTSMAAKTGEPFIMADVQTDTRHFNDVDQTDVIQTRSLLNLPLKIKGNVIGVLNLTDSTVGRFTDDDLRLLEPIATTIANAIENSRLFEQEQRQRLIAESLRQAMLALSMSMDNTTVITEILTQLKNIIFYDSAGLFLAEGKNLRLASGVGINPKTIDLLLPLNSNNPTVKTFKRRQAKILPDVRADPKWQILSDAKPISSSMTAPLIVGQEAVGVLTLNRFEQKVFTEEELNILQAFANQAAIIIKNTALQRQAQSAAVLEERNRLARELHDAVNQTLFTASIMADAVPRAWDMDPVHGRRGMEEVRRLTQTALVEMRSLLLELRPQAITEKPLGQLLTYLIQTITSRVPVALTVENDQILRPDLQLAFYRVAQESLNNTVKHAQAGQVNIYLNCRPNQVVLHVQDDGKGFNPAETPPGCLGLRIMQERADEVGATLTLTSQPDAGASVELVWTEELTND